MDLTVNVQITGYIIAYAVVMAIRNIIEIFVRPKTGIRSGYDTKDKLTLLAFFLAYLISSLTVGIFLLTDRNIGPITFFIGMLTIAAGYAGRITSLRRISSSYNQSMKPNPDAVLVTGGVYSLIRHPLYFFYALEMLGIVAVRFNLVSLAMLAADLTITLYRINREEYLLTEKYGSNYREYRQATKRLIPFIF